MPSQPIRVPFLSLLIAFILSATLHASDAQKPSRLAHIPTTNPYLALLAEVATPSPEEAQNLDGWLNTSVKATSSPPFGNQLKLATAIALKLARTTPPAGTDIWPVVFNESSTEEPKVPPYAELRRLTRLAQIGARTLPPEQAVAVNLSVMQLSRTLRSQEGTLVHHMIGTVLETQAQRELAARLGQLPPVALEKLLADLSRLPASPTGKAAFAGEARYFEASLRKTYLPKLQASQTDKTDAAAKLPAAARTFSNGLRLSGVVVMGDARKWITVDNENTGHQFRLEPGQTEDGVTLISINPAKRQALLRHAQGEVVIDLRSKVIRERPGSALAKLHQELRAAADRDPPPSDEERKTLQEKLRLAIQKTPGGAEGYIDSLVASYEIAIEHIAEQAALPRLSDIRPWPLLDEADPLTHSALDGMPKVARSFAERDQSEAMLLAAVRHQLSPSTASPAPSAFTLEPDPTGGFVLRSDFETKPGLGLTYKFATPDAGKK